MSRRGRTMLLGSAVGAGGGGTAVSVPVAGDGTANSVAKFTAAGVIDDTLFLTDSVNGVGINRTLAAATHFVDIVAGTLAASQSAFKVTGTLNTANASGANFVITTAGSAATIQAGLAATLSAGYTGTGVTAAANALNVVAGVGVSGLTGGGANYGGLFQMASTTIGHNVAVNGTAEGSSVLNAGGIFLSVETSAGANVGVLGRTVNAGAGTKTSGFFTFGSSAPSISAALMADNGASTDPIFVARDNAVVAFSVVDGGHINTLSSANMLKVGTPVVTGDGTLVANSKDSMGKVLSTVTAGATITVTFSSAFTRAPACSGSNETTANLMSFTSTTTTLVITGVTVTGDSISYACVGY